MIPWLYCFQFVFLCFWRNQTRFCTNIMYKALGHISTSNTWQLCLFQWQPNCVALSNEERVKQIVLKTIFQLLHSSLSHFILQIMGKILSQRSMFTTLRVDIFVLLIPKKEYHSLTSSVNTQNKTKKKKPKTSKVLIISGWKLLHCEKKKTRVDTLKHFFASQADVFAWVYNLPGYCKNILWLLVSSLLQ